MTPDDSSNASSPSGRRRRHSRSLPRFSRALALAATLGATVLAAQVVSSEAQAGVPRVLREGTRPMAFLLGLGPSWGVGGSRWYYGGPGPDYYGPGYYGWGGRYGGTFKLTQEFMGHFSGNASGPALGILLNQTFNGPFFGFAIAPKFTYDIRVKPGLGLYISPSISLGYALQHDRYNNGYYYGGRNWHAANLQFGVAVKLMLDDRWIVFAQVPNFDFNIGPGNYYYGNNGGCAPGYNCGTYFTARLDFILGGGVTF